MLKPVEIGYDKRSLYDGAEPTFSESWVAEVKTYTSPISDAFTEFARFGAADIDHSFDFATAMEQAPELEPFAYHLAHARNKDHFDFLSASLQRNQARREVMANTSFLTSIGTAVTNPLNLLFAFPALGVVKGAITGTAKISAAAAAGAKQGFAAGVAFEGIRYPFDPLESGVEALANIGASTAFGGVLGGAIPGGFHFVKHVMPENARRLVPFINRSEDGMKKFEEDHLDDTIKAVDDEADLTEIDIIYTDDAMLDAPVVSRGTRTEAFETDADTVVIYADDGAPTRVEVAERLEDGNIAYIENGQRFVVAKEELTSPFELESIPSPLVRDDGTQPTVQQLLDEEVDEALGLVDLSDRVVTSLKARKGELTRPEDPARPTDVVQTEEIVVNLDRARDDYHTLKFTFPEVEGSTALAKNAFPTFKHYTDFLVYKERRKRNESKRPGESDAAFEDRINTLAMSDGANGWSTKKTTFTDLSPFGSPVFNVLRLSDKDMPQGIKRMLALLTGNNQIALDRNTAGFGTNGVDQQKNRGTVMFRKTMENLQDIWVQDVKGKDGALRVRSIGFSTADWSLAKTSFKDWMEREVAVYLSGMPGKRTPTQKKIEGEIKGLLDDFLDMAQDDGMLLGIENYDVEINRLTDEIAYQQDLVNKFEGDPDKVAQLANAKQLIEELELGPDGLLAMIDAKTTAGGRSNYRWPRYFDVLALRKSEKGDKVYYNELRNMLIEEYSTKPPRKRFNEKTGKTEDYVSDPVKDADETLGNIIRDDNDPSAYIGGVGKGKHLRRRVLNIPDSKLSKFLVKDVTVLGAYADKMGFRMAWKRNFGDKTLEGALNDIRQIAKDAGLSDKRTKQAVQAFYGDYLRATGTHIRNPHSFDNQTAKVLSDYAGIVHLAGSGLTATQDLVNMIGARSLTDMFGMLREMGDLFNNVKDLEGFTEVLSMAPNMIKEQMMADAKTGLQPTLAEKITHFPSKVMFNLPVIGNDLHAITSLTRRIAASMNISDIIKIAYKIADPDQTPTAMELQQAGTLGIEPKVAEYIYSQRNVIEKGKSVYRANTTKWEMDTPEARSAYDTFLTAIDIATDSQIIMAKSFDKPLISDGVAFVRFHPAMEVFGMKADPLMTVNGREYARVQSGILKFPFQFWNYSWGAASSVLGKSFDPTHERRLQHIAVSAAAGYLLLKATKPDWWFENKDTTEIAMRSIDRSGVMSIYGDMAYDAIHMATATGLVDPEDMPVRGKIARPGTSDIYGLAGPAPSLAWNLQSAFKDYLENNTDGNARELSRALPRFVVPGQAALDFSLFHKKFLRD